MITLADVKIQLEYNIKILTARVVFLKKSFIPGSNEFEVNDAEDSLVDAQRLHAVLFSKLFLDANGALMCNYGNDQNFSFKCPEVPNLSKS